MNIRCPICHSPQVETNDYGKYVGAGIGAVGAIVALCCLSDDGIDSLENFGGVLAKVAVASVAGAGVGKLVDDEVLDNYHCRQCDASFSKHRC